MRTTRFPPPKLSILAAIVLGALAPSRAHAACSWLPAMAMAQLTNEPSHGFQLAWSPSFVGGSCGSFTLDHFQVVLNDDHSPTSPTDGPVVINTNNHILDVRPHRAQRLYYAKIYACDNTSCSDVFGSGAGESIISYAGCSDTCSGETAQEVWTIWDMDWTVESVLNVGMTGPDVGTFWYSATSSSYPGRLGLLRGNSLDSLFWFVAVDQGWMNFNDPANWDTASGSQWSGSHETDPDYDGVTHAYPYTVTDGTTEEIYMLAQNMGASTDQIVWATVPDGDPPIVDIACYDCCPGGTTGPCDWPAGETAGIAGVAFDPTTYNLDNALHGRWMWNRIDEGLPDMSVDNPSILFTGSLDSSCVGSSNAQIFQADWDAATGWIPRDDDSDGCPDVLIDDAHDPGITPLPGGDFKVYVVSAAHDVVTWYFHDGEIETKTATPVIQWENGPTTTVSHDCVANLDSFAMVQSGVPHEGMFLFIAQSKDTEFQKIETITGCPAEGGTFDGDESTDATPPGIYFAKLTN